MTERPNAPTPPSCDLAPKPALRQPRWPNLIAALALSPALAGLIGGPLVVLTVFVIDWVTMPDTFGPGNLTLDSLFSTLGGFIALSLLSLIIAIPMTYIFGVLPIVGLWALFHYKGWRAPKQIRWASMAAGLIFAIAYACLNGEPSMSVIFILPALIAGYAVGMIISAWGYRESQHVSS
ncbi:hypothetical protein [Woodsholea maritima]|uniref:hypothetical protein n=1 Tax=Woodsholea maritima TaxID=240237 RepID=UPI000378CD9E|nr:hypothetical protein [Woodsholea maritima]